MDRESVTLRVRTKISVVSVGSVQNKKRTRKYTENTETDEGTVQITRIKRRQMDREYVTLRETPYSNKNIRSIREISTEQKRTRRHTEKHGDG